MQRDEIKEPGEWCDLAGASALRMQIENYWKARGFAVQVDLTPGGYTQTMRSNRFDVRSNLINGMPRRVA